MSLSVTRIAFKRSLSIMVTICLYLKPAGSGCHGAVVFGGVIAAPPANLQLAVFSILSYFSRMSTRNIGININHGALTAWPMASAACLLS